MVIDDQREISLEILTNPKRKFNLYNEFPTVIKDNDDLIDISSFLERYLNKHDIDYFSVNSSGDFEIKDALLPPVLCFVKKMTPTKFEKLSAVLISSFGFDEFFATKKTHDQGIDVIGSSSHFIKYFNKSSSYRCFIFGQCKKYKKTLVDNGEIHNLTGAITHFKNREFAVNDPSTVYKNFNIKSHSPVQAMYFSGYFFSDFALKLCYNSDIIPVDIIDFVLLIVQQIRCNKFSWVKKSSSLNFGLINKEISKVIVEK